MSGSPIPRLITSIPSACFAAILRSSSANMYGGIASRRRGGIGQRHGRERLSSAMGATAGRASVRCAPPWLDVSVASDVRPASCSTFEAAHPRPRPRRPGRRTSRRRSSRRPYRHPASPPVPPPTSPSMSSVSAFAVRVQWCRRQRRPSSTPVSVMLDRASASSLSLAVSPTPNASRLSGRRSRRSEPLTSLVRALPRSRRRARRDRPARRSRSGSRRARR